MTVDIVFLDLQGNEVQLPAGTSASWSVADEEVASILPGSGPTNFTVHGLRVGATTATIQVPADASRSSQGLAPLPPFQSPVVHIVVLDQSYDFGAIVLFEGCQGIASWNYNPEFGANEAIGPIVLDEGQSDAECAAQFLEPYVTDHVERVLAGAPSPGFEITWVSSDPAVVTAQPGSEVEGALSFRLSSGNPGWATLDGSLEFYGLVRARYPGIPVRVVGASEGIPARFVLQESGAWRLIVLDGIVPPEGGCGFEQNPGWISARVGELTPHFNFRLLNDECQRVFLDPAVDQVVFRFEDPCVVRTIGHPYHWGGTVSFHFSGTAAATVMGRAYYFHEGEFVFRSPPFSVVVTSP